VSFRSPNIRPARVEDADAIGRIHVLSWQAAYADALPAEFLRTLSVQGRQDRWRDRLAATDRAVRVLVVVDNATVVGFECVGPSRDDAASPEVGELQSIYLDPAKWGQGLGTALHDEGLNTLRQDGYTSATLWVLDSNGRARRFYERAGWTFDGVTKVDTIADSPPVTEVRYRRALR